jgi:hypothetical protein
MLACLHYYPERILTEKMSYFSHFLKAILIRSEFLDLDRETLSSCNTGNTVITTNPDFNQPDILGLVFLLDNWMNHLIAHLIGQQLIKHSINTLVQTLEQTLDTLY